MGKTAILAIRIIGDATDAVTALDKVDGSAKSMQSSMDRASVGAGVALGGLAAAAAAAGSAASELEQSAGAVDSVFGSYSDKVTGYAQNAADAVGLSESAYNNLAAVMGSQLKNMGVSMDEVAGQSDSLISLGADLAATFGGTTSEAVSALSSLLRGERDPIERYGVSMNQAAIDAQKAAMGLSGLTGEADKNANLQATLALLTQQTADVQGQFGREADTAAGMQQRANAEWENASAALGEQLLPVMTESATVLADLAKWIGENQGLVTALAIGIGILASGILVINGAMKVYAAIQAVQTAAQWANNAAWLASPITWIILAIVAAIAIVIAIIVLVITYWDELAAGAERAWSAIVGWIAGAVGWLRDGIVGAIQAVMGFFQQLGNTISKAFSTVVNWIRDAYNWLMRLVGKAMPGWVKDLLGMKTFSAAMTVEEPALKTSPMLFTAAETMDGYTYNTAPTTLAASSPLIPAALGTAATGNAAPVVQVTNNYRVTVEGAIDPNGTARTIEDVLTKYGQSTGEIPAAGVAWR